MNSIKKSILAATLTVLLGVLSAGGAMASAFYPVEITTLTNYLNLNGVSYSGYSGSLNGFNYVTPVGYEATDNIQFKSTVDGLLFTNKNLATEFGDVRNTSLSNTYFKDITTNNITGLTDACRVQILKLTSDWTLSSGLVLSSGTLILGLNDTGSKDGDFDDFIIAASKSAPTPVPAAVWLLGSGLLGVMGFKRTRKTDKAEA